jgi:hypothetical protein
MGDALEAERELLHLQEGLFVVVNVKELIVKRMVREEFPGQRLEESTINKIDIGAQTRVPQLPQSRLETDTACVCIPCCLALVETLWISNN